MLSLLMKRGKLKEKKRKRFTRLKLNTISTELLQSLNKFMR